MPEPDVAGGPLPRDPRDLPSALDREEEIRRRISGRRIAVFLDYDGTLTPIVDDPDQATLSREMRASIAELARLCTVAVISGRDLQDVRKHVDIDSIIYAGSHGFELAGPDSWHREYEGGSRFLDELDEAEGELREGLNVPGARVERKRFAIAVHYRQVGDGDVPAVEALVDGVQVRHAGLRKTGGKKIFELRPDIDWDKGRALLWLLGELGLDAADVVPFYVGDDVTDEDAFRAIRDRGVGIVVRDGVLETEAKYALDGTDDVRRLLTMLVEELKRSGR